MFIHLSVCQISILLSLYYKYYYYYYIINIFIITMNKTVLIITIIMLILLIVFVNIISMTEYYNCDCYYWQYYHFYYLWMICRIWIGADLGIIPLIGIGNFERGRKPDFFFRAQFVVERRNSGKPVDKMSAVWK